MRTAALPRWVFASACLTVALTAFEAGYLAPQGRFLAHDHPSGTWTTMAVDLAHGLFYRPLQSTIGYGGTRYMPLYVVLHAALIRFGLDAERAGHVLTLAATTLLLFGLYRVQRAMGICRGQAAAFAALCLAAPAISLGAVRITGDLLALALEVWALAVVLPETPVGSRRIIEAGALLALAILTKFVAVSVFVTVLLVIWFRGERRQALVLLLTVVIQVAALFAVADWFSQGRMHTSLLACATGNPRLRDVFRAPFLFWSYLPASDIALMTVSGAAAISRLWRSRLDIAAAWFVLCAVTTLLLFASPGVNMNHFAGLEASSFLILSLELIETNLPRVFTLAVMLLVVSTGLLASVRAFVLGAGQPIRLVAERIERDARPILSENPWVPIAAGEQPVVLDPFMFRIVAKNHPEMSDELRDRLDRQSFRAVVLEYRLASLDATTTIPGWYESTHFGPGFADAVRRNYELRDDLGDLFVYVPKRR